MEKVKFNYLSCDDQDIFYNKINYGSHSSILSDKNIEFLLDILSMPINNDEKSLQMIKEAIEANKKGIPTKVDAMVFAKSRPDSIKYVKEYFDSLYSAFMKKQSLFDGLSWILEEKAEGIWKIRIQNEKKFINMIYINEMLNTNKDVFFKTINSLGITFKEAINMLEKFNLIVKEKLNSDNIFDEVVELKKIVINDFISNNITKDSICHKYDISANTFDKIVQEISQDDTNLVRIINDKLQRTKQDYYHEYFEVIKEIGYYLQNGIEYNNQKIDFSILDYYSLTNIPLKDLYVFIKGNIYNNSDCKTFKNFIIKFLAKTKNPGALVGFEEIIKKNISFTINDKKTIVDEALAIEMLTLFENNNIPKQFNILYQAFRRKAANLPILPLKLQEKTKTANK